MRQYLTHWIAVTKNRMPPRMTPVPLKTLMIFFQQFATLHAAGISLIRICDMLADSQQQISFRRVILDLQQEILAGNPLHQAMRKHPDCFSALICHLIHVGESTGKLDTILFMISTYLEKQHSLRKQIRQALFYPVVIFITGILMTLALTVFIIPKFADLFHDHLDQLPLLTKCLFSFSAYIQQIAGWPLALLAGLLYILVHRLNLLNPHNVMLSVLSKLPLVSSAYHQLMLARFARILALTYHAGIPIIDALKLSAKVCHHAELTQQIAKARADICTGLQLNQALAKHAHFPQLMLQMIKTGEETGHLDTMLDKTATIYESEGEALLHHLSQLLEPLIMVILGVLIGGLVIGMYLPIFKLGSLF